MQPSLLSFTPFAFFAIVLAVVQIGCRPRQTVVEAARVTQTLHIGNGAEPQDLDPQTTIVYTDYNILIALFEGLTVIDEATSEPIPGTASHWDVSDDGLRYTFHLRPAARWSNGDPVTARDFVFSFQRILSPALGAEYAYMLYAIKNAEAYNTGALKDFSQVGVRATGTFDLEVTLAQPTPQLLSLAAHQAWFPVHPATILAHGRIDQRDTRWTVPGKLTCNGPYLLKDWLPNQRITVVRNPQYWNAALTAPASGAGAGADDTAEGGGGGEGDTFGKSFFIRRTILPPTKRRFAPDACTSPTTSCPIAWNITVAPRLARSASIRCSKRFSFVSTRS